MLDGVLRKLVFGIVAVLAIAAFDARSRDRSRAARQIPSSRSTRARPSQSIKLGQGKSIFIDLPRDARDVLVSDPRIADAVIRTPRRIYLTDPAGLGAVRLRADQRHRLRSRRRTDRQPRGFDRAGATPTILEEVLARLIPGSDDQGRMGSAGRARQHRPVGNRQERPRRHARHRTSPTHSSASCRRPARRRGAP